MSAASQILAYPPRAIPRCLAAVLAAPCRINTTRLCARIFRNSSIWKQSCVHRMSGPYLLLQMPVWICNVFHSVVPSMRPDPSEVTIRALEKEIIVLRQALHGRPAPLTPAGKFMMAGGTSTPRTPTGPPMTPAGLQRPWGRAPITPNLPPMRAPSTPDLQPMMRDRSHTPRRCR